MLTPHGFNSLHICKYIITSETYRGSSRVGLVQTHEIHVSRTHTHTSSVNGKEDSASWWSPHSHHTHKHRHLIPRSICHPSKSYSSNFLFTAVEPLQRSVSISLSSLFYVSIVWASQTVWYTEKLNTFSALEKNKNARLSHLIGCWASKILFSKNSFTWNKYLFW